CVSEAIIALPVVYMQAKMDRKRRKIDGGFCAENQGNAKRKRLTKSLHFEGFLTAEVGVTTTIRLVTR
ncbi:MAG: hypothetical protein NTW42_11255, partial [Deltaproteobacteria bacterium]|nr:hypothetical protein [Deltaproteobacteria bacterium]